MKGLGFFARGVAVTALVALPMSAFAEGKTEQARKAIAAAQAKVEAGNTVGAAGDAPRFQKQAVDALRLARDELAHHDKDAAIRDATHAQELADMALSASTHARQQEATDQAQRQAAAANARANDANARAADAQASAAAAQADANAARSAPPVVIQAPAPPPPAPTTVTTETTQTTPASVTTTSKAPVKRRVVHHVVRHTTHPTTVTHTKTTVATGTPDSN